MWRSLGVWAFRSGQPWRVVTRLAQEWGKWNLMAVDTDSPCPCGGLYPAGVCPLGHDERTTMRLSDFEIRSDVAIEAAADALLAVCALQTGTDPRLAWERAQRVLEYVYRKAERESRG